MGNTQSPPQCPAPSIKSFVVVNDTITFYDSETDPNAKLFSKPYLFSCFFDRIEKDVLGYTIFHKNKRMGTFRIDNSRLFFMGDIYHPSFGMNISEETGNQLKTELDKRVTVSRFGSPRVSKRKKSPGRRR